jgi:hypothetical protein
MSHGIGGPLTLLALTALARITVHGHTDAITTICRWLDRWQTGPRWPYWITPASLRTGQPAPTDFGRPSWCYGTAGIARAQQLAALALADTTRQHRAEQALVAALDDPAQLAATIDASLCHGYAGLTHLATLVAADAHPATTAALRQRIPYLLHHITRAPDDPADIARALITADRSGPGLLDGAAGTALAIRSTARRPCVAWDAVLLTTSPTTPGVRNSQEASP